MPESSSLETALLKGSIYDYTRKCLANNLMRDVEVLFGKKLQSLVE